MSTMRRKVSGEVPEALRLARSIWPRTAGGTRHARRVQVRGPSEGRVVREIALEGSTERTARGIGVARDGSLRVSAGGQLVAIERAAVVAWSVEIASKRARKVVSAPAVLDDGSCVITCGRAVCFVDAHGAVRGRIELEVGLDDSGPAPNVTPDGALIVTCPTGEVIRIDADGARELGAFGYDVVAPAIDDEGAMYVAGYAGRGAVCLEPDGRVRWRGGARDADMLATVRATGESAFGVVNDGRTVFIARDGSQLGAYGAAGGCGELSGGDWALVAQDRVARVDARGVARWERALVLPSLHWGGLGPVIDRDDRLAVPTLEGVELLDARNGSVVAAVALGEPPIDLAMIAEGRVAVLLATRLVIID
ncbi:hypothetical protein [Sandaracinus amylolyticus]|uniref:hypothetical protein n=1 Tax=Sandaracinus amylolyticus TaxID=927083 RepID=UPI001F3BF098|nr:hypothetical protein [Sandaracinus amylolyticus]UJR83314.1 Hypothetical protein I5071_53820 [Sandaracinus amylolyticus]